MTLSNEWRFIFQCVRRAFARTEPPTLAGDESSLDWDLVLRYSVESGLQPLVFAGLPVAPAGPPPRYRAYLQAGYLAAQARTRFYVEPTLRLVLEALRAEDIPATPLKGAALAYTVYPEPALRTMSDLDILVPAGDLFRGWNVLRALGMAEGEPSEQVVSYQLPKCSVANGHFAVELHQQLLLESCPYRISMDGWWARSRPARVAGADARLASPADELLHTCVHVSHHHGYRRYALRALSDILALTSHYEGEIDWDDFAATVRSSRTEGAVYWPLLLAVMWLDAPVPESLLRELAPGWLPYGHTLSTLVDLSLDGGRAAEDSMQRLLVLLSTYPNRAFAAKLSASWQVLFPYRSAEVSSPISHLLALVNPYRLVRGAAAVRRTIGTRLEGGSS